MDDAEAWADFEAAKFHPLVEDQPDLAERLWIRFLQRLTAEMSPSEREYAEGWGPPCFDVGVTPRGNRVLRITFAGGSSTTDWSGSEAEAHEIADSVATTSAYDSETDFWVNGGGWRSRSSDDLSD